MFSDRELVLCELLVLRCLRRDPQAATELMAIFERPVLYFLRRLLDSEADAWDVLQETWLAVFRGLPRLREPRALPAFVYRVARNAALAHRRKQESAAALVEAAGGELTESECAEDSFSAEEAECVHRGLSRLALPHREVLTLFFLRDLTIEEIATVVGAPVGTVKSRLFHAKRTLRRILEEGGAG